MTEDRYAERWAYGLFPGLLWAGLVAGVLPLAVNTAIDDWVPAFQGQYLETVDFILLFLQILIFFAVTGPRRTDLGADFLLVFASVFLGGLFGPVLNYAVSLVQGGFGASPNLVWVLLGSAGGTIVDAMRTAFLGFAVVMFANLESVKAGNADSKPTDAGAGMEVVVVGLVLVLSSVLDDLAADSYALSLNLNAGVVASFAVRQWSGLLFELAIPFAVILFMAQRAKPDPFKNAPQKAFLIFVGGAMVALLGIAAQDAVGPAVMPGLEMVALNSSTFVPDYLLPVIEGGIGLVFLAFTAMVFAKFSNYGSMTRFRDWLNEEPGAEGERAGPGTGTPNER